MGVQLEAICPCGYEGKATVASGRRDHGKKFFFPYECTDCKEVTSIDVLKSPVACSKCGGQNVNMYGFAVHHVEHDKWSQLKSWFDGSRKREKEGMALLEKPRVHENYCYNINATFAMKTGPARCPVCKNQTLIFSEYSIFS